MGADVPKDEIRAAQEVRQMPAEQAESHHPVRLRGVLTFFDQRIPSKSFRFIQDGTAGIYFAMAATGGRVRPWRGPVGGAPGETGQGEYAPIVVARHIQVLGDGKFPAARPVSFEQLASGQEDSQFVEVQGTVRSARFDEELKCYSMEIATGGGRITAYASELPVARREDLPDSTIRVRGVCATYFNLQRQLFDIRLLVPRPADAVVEAPPPHDPAAIPTQSITSLLRFTPQGAYGHRVKVSGTVTCQQTNKIPSNQGQQGGLVCADD